VDALLRMQGWHDSHTMRQRADETHDVSEILTMGSAFVQMVHATLGIRGAGRGRFPFRGLGHGDFTFVGSSGFGLFWSCDAVRLGFVWGEVRPAGTGAAFW
jgi:hypothetical protein